MQGSLSVTARSTHKTTMSYNSPYVGLTVVEDTPILHTSTPILDFVRYVEDKKRILPHKVHQRAMASLSRNTTSPKRIYEVKDEGHEVVHRNVLLN